MTGRNVALAPLLEEMEDLAGLSLDHHMTIAIQAPADLAAYVDPEQFSRALTNIVRNAVQALDAAGTQEQAPLGGGERQSRDGDPEIAKELGIRIGLVVGCGEQALAIEDRVGSGHEAQDLGLARQFLPSGAQPDARARHHDARRRAHPR